MKRILIQGYFNGNFGDDLIISCFIKKILQENIDVVVMDYLGCLKNEKIKVNIPYCISFINKVQNKLMSFIPGKAQRFIKKQNTNMLDTYLRKNIDILLQVGGSLFQESEAQAKQNLNRNRNALEIEQNSFDKQFIIPRIVVGCNFGPYKTDYYLEYYKKYFNNCKKVYFREVLSYNLFSQIDSCNLSTDTAFLSDIVQSKETKKKIVISVMDFEKRFGKTLNENYIQCISNIIKKYNLEGYSVTLIGFCKAEGDDEAIKNIIASTPNIDIDTVLYKDNLQSVIDEFDSAEIVFATRFHAMILSLILKKPVYVFSYSNKTLNFISDNNFSQEFVCDITNNVFPDSVKTFSKLQNFKNLVDLDSIYIKNRKSAETMLKEIIDICKK